ncbi:LINC00502 isoform 2 [Pan troglodytes]|uniref:LINC00502 isoform 2 n=1 Tax=Pan troglodytes TaxID=9598 RepID=A0A2J8PE98_PANTR|nr:LINC00502 isoform 2 [Pan troglodytes]
MHRAGKHNLPCISCNTKEDGCLGLPCLLAIKEMATAKQCEVTAPESFLHQRSRSVPFRVGKQEITSSSLLLELIT